MWLLLSWLACSEGKGIVVGSTPPGPGDSGGTGDAGAAAELVVSPTVVDLGTVLLGQPAEVTLDLANVGEAAAVLNEQLDGSPDWTASLSSTIVAAGGVVTATLRLEAPAFGSYPGSYTVTDSEGGSTVTVPLSALVVEDADGDGAGSVASGGDDCDDTDAAVLPGAEDAWYDGVDSDCAGNDDFDQDGDGTRVEGDCDDADATVYPGAADTWYDGVDSDCAADDDFDQDVDGFTVDVDCDDGDDTVNPGARDTWYDGVDSDCGGEDDYDQDGDGHQSDAFGGDDCDDLAATTYPGAEEQWYDGIDQDCAGGDDDDQDGDGVAWPDDCNDLDATTTGPAPEVLNHYDDDCDGVIDDVLVSDVVNTLILGDIDEMGLGSSGTMVYGGDVTGDGVADLALTSDLGSSFTWVVGGAVAGTVGNIGDLAVVEIAGDRDRPFLRPSWGDATADGTADLLVGGYDSGDSDGAVWLYRGGASLTGELSDSDAIAEFTGDSDSDMTSVAAVADLDGDGLAEVVIGSPRDNYVSGRTSDTESGNVAVFSGAYAGTLDLSSSEDQIHGADEYDYFGDELVAADLDADGYADILAGAPGVDVGWSWDAGSVYMIGGGATLAWDSRADDAAGLQITGDGGDQDLGEDPLPAPGDQDGDGTLDLAIGSGQEGRVWLWWDGTSLSGVTDVGSADVVFTGPDEFGGAIGASSDLDGDGGDELSVGARGEDVGADDAGALFVFSGGAWAGLVDAPEATATVYGVNEDDNFGTGIATGGDVDLDGLDDVFVGAPGLDTGAANGGGVYLLTGW